MTTTLDAALAYAARGWRVLPLAGKIPTTAHGVKDATTDETQIRAWFARDPRANVGIACGAASGLLVVDVDPRNGGDQTIAALDPPPTYTVRTGGGGLHLYYRWPGARAPKGGRNRFGPGVDCQTEGRYVVAPPSLHPETGQPYEALGGELAELPQALIDAAKPPPSAVERALARPIVVPVGDVVDRARRYVDTMDPSVSGHGGHDALFRVCCALVQGFALDVESARPIVDDYNATKAAPQWSDREIRHKLADAEKAGSYGGRPRGCLLERQTPSATPTRALAVARPARRVLLPDEVILKPPGFVGEVVRWIDAAAVYPCPLLSVAAALTVAATICGRRYRTTTGVRPVLYVCGVAESGVGKENARQCALSLLRASGLDKRVGYDEVSSAAALSTMLLAEPARLCLFDEFGRMIEAFTSRNAASFERAIVSALLKLWSCPDGTYLGKGKAEQATTPSILNPHLSLYATTTPSSLFRALRGSDVSDGVLSRILTVVVDHGQLPEREPTASRSEPPAGLVEQARAIAAGPALAGSLARCDLPQGMSVQASEVTIAPAARDLLGDLGAFVRGALEERREHRDLWVRAREQALRVAIVVAVGCGRREIDRDHLEWAWTLVRWCVERSLQIVERHVAEDAEDAARLAVLRVLDAGPARKSHVTHALWRVPRRTREEAIKTLLESGKIVAATLGSSVVYQLADE